MQASLRLLGYYDVHHGFDLVDSPSSTSNWEAITDAEFNGNIGLCSRTAFDTLRSHCAAVTDSPCAFFAENLVNAYPEIYSSTKAEAVAICCLLRGIYKCESSLSNEVTRNAMPRSDLFSTAYRLEGFVLFCLDHILVYFGLCTYRKLWLGYFHAFSASELVANLSPVYSEHYIRTKRQMPVD